LIDLPVPAVTRVGAPAVKTEQVVNRVLAKLDERSKQRKIVWGGIAAVAVLVGAVGSVFTFNSSTMSLDGGVAVNDIQPRANSEEPLLLAMEKPLIPMPKSALSDIK
jgi:hypothetical protein